ncbi:alpha/beta hydrolase [Salinibius halmophilus]|uniref:alpha/beta hydrolase n=1 Tax=Salinibius halmophilus TaxID=1853216 RepID=UPI000E66B846|nr:hypothetical protein [Salinibius halmophilus]
MQQFAIIITIVLVISGCATSPPLPQPSGSDLVGYQRTPIGNDDHWVDVQAYYPAQAESDTRLVATPDDLAGVMANAYGMPAFLMRDNRLLDVFIEAPPALGRFPVLIFNHGHSSFARQNQANFIELASQGYVVLTLNHPGYSLLSKNGEQAVQQTPVASSGPIDMDLALNQLAQDFDALRQADKLNQWLVTMAQVEQNSFAAVLAEFDQWVANNELVLNQLVAGDTELLVQAHLNLEHLGYFGHSFGGAVATYMNMNSALVDASFNLDGPVFAKSVNTTDAGAYCFAYGNEGHGDKHGSDFSYINQPLAQALNGCEVVFQGAQHMNFSDLNQLPILRRFGVLGSVDTELMQDNLNQVLLDFFNQHLRNQGEISKLSGTQLTQH